MTRPGTTRWHYLRDWIKVDRRFPKSRGHYPDGAIAALTFAFCKAAEQPEPGTFDTVPVLKAILDATGNRRGRWVGFLTDKGDLALGDDGSVTLPNWRTFQEEGRSTERVKKHRETSEKHDGNAGETSEEHSHVGAGGDERLPTGEMKDERLLSGEREPDAPVAYHSLTGRFPTGNVRAWLDEIAKQYGHRAVERALSAEMVADATLSTLLSRTQNRLASEAHERQKAAQVKKQPKTPEEEAALKQRRDAVYRDSLTVVVGGQK